MMKKSFMTHWSGALNTIIITAYGVFSILRAPKIFAGRFRAEEGVFYGLFQHGTAFKNLFLTGTSYPMVLTNASALLAGLFPVQYAPLVTTAIGFAVQILLVALLVLWRERIGLNLCDQRFDCGSAHCHSAQCRAFHSGPGSDFHCYRRVSQIKEVEKTPLKVAASGSVLAADDRKSNPAGGLDSGRLSLEFAGIAPRSFSNYPHPHW